MSSQDSRRHRTLVVMVWCEAIAFAWVLAAAWPANSLTLWASVLRVGLDLPASFFALYVSRRILRQENGRFDYGLGKWENFAALLNVPVMLVGLAFLAFRAVLVFLNPQPVTHTGFGLAVLVVFGIVNVVLMLRFRRLNGQAPTPLVHAQFVLYRNATAASLLSVLALAGARGAGPLGGYFDILGAAILAVLILQSAFVLLRQSISALLDEAVEESLQQRILQELTGAKQEFLRLHRKPFPTCGRPNLCRAATGIRTGNLGSGNARPCRTRSPDDRTHCSRRRSVHSAV